MKKRAPSSWWGDFELPRGEAAHWRIASLELIAQRREGEWQIGHSRQTEWDSPESERWEFSVEQVSPEELAHVERFVFHRTEVPLRLLPVLADRPVVTSPRVPVTILAGEEAVLFVGSPLWVRLSAGDPPVILRELPIRRPSDSWFGPSTRAGELCYGTRTRAILRTENLPLLAQRAITPVLVRNEADEALLLERLKLPVPLLSVFASQRGRLWTERVSLVRQEVGEMATVEVEEGAPEGVDGRMERLTLPREEVQPGTLSRVFSGLFGN